MGSRRSATPPNQIGRRLEQKAITFSLGHPGDAPEASREIAAAEVVDPDLRARRLARALRLWAEHGAQSGSC